MAASSRPDLIDPALLRPGRIDNLVHCSLPDKIEMKEILNVLSDKINLDPGINLDDIVDRMIGFSGADIKAMIFTAQLNSRERCSTSLSDHNNEESAIASESELRHIYNPIDRSWSKTTNSHYHQSFNNQNNIESNSISITKEDLINAINETQPSISTKELSRYHNM